MRQKVGNDHLSYERLFGEIDDGEVAIARLGRMLGGGNFPMSQTLGRRNGQLTVHLIL